jgi:hypothetical protein
LGAITGLVLGIVVIVTEIELGEQQVSVSSTGVGALDVLGMVEEFSGATYMTPTGGPDLSRPRMITQG